MTDDPTRPDPSTDDGDDDGSRRRMHLEFRQEPLRDIDPEDADAVLAWARHHVDVALKLNGRVRDELALFYAERLLHGPIDGLVELGEEAILVAMCRRFGGDEVLARVRVGPVMVSGEGGRRRAAAMLRYLDDEAWEAWWRPCGTAPSGVGVWHGDWQALAGTGVDDAPDWLREWVDEGTASLESSHMETTPDGGPDIRMAMLPPPQAALPPEPGPVAAGLHAGGLDREILRQGLTCFLVFVVRPELVERWELRNMGAVDLHDMIRLICSQGDPPEAVSLVHPGVVTWHDGRSLRAVLSVTERCGQRVRRALALEPGPDGGLQALEPAYMPVPDDEPPVGGWIGVPPSGEITLTLPSATLEA